MPPHAERADEIGVKFVDFNVIDGKLILLWRHADNCRRPPAAAEGYLLSISRGTKTVIFPGRVAYLEYVTTLELTDFRPTSALDTKRVLRRSGHCVGVTDLSVVVDAVHEPVVVNKGLHDLAVTLLPGRFVARQHGHTNGELRNLNKTVNR